nr:hypothetical protein [Burkholderiales bacterium]
MNDPLDCPPSMPDLAAATTPAAGTAALRTLAVTHEVINQPAELADCNLYASDSALREAVAREGAGWA